MTSIPRSFKRTLLAGGAVLVLGGAAVGIAAAQTQPTPTSPSQQAQSGYQKFVSALATRLGIDPAKLETAIGQARTDAGFPAGNAFPGREGRGKGGLGGGVELQTAATFLGLQPAELRTAMQTKSLTTIAGDQHKSATDLANALKASANSRIDAAVTAGKVTAADAATHKTQVASRIDQLMTQVLPKRGGSRGADGEDPNA